MKFLTVGPIGTKRQPTKEGFLVCMDVPIARTGEMIYGPGEVPITPGHDGAIRIQRDEAEVFRAETIASANGKPVVEEHPSDDVTPKNWRQLACGVMLNPRRGEGDQSEFLLADLMITDAEVMRAIEDGKREVSCGYDANYDELGPGLGRQHTIIINHLALVDRGRCGPSCAIGDQATPVEEPTMAKTNDRRPFLDRVLQRAFKAKDAEELKEIAKDAEEMIEGPAPGGEPLIITPPTGDNEVHLHLAGDPEMRDDEPSIHPDIASRLERLESGHDELMAGMQGVRDSLEDLIGKKKTGDEPSERSEMAERIKEEEEKGKKKSEDDAVEQPGGVAILNELEVEAPPGTSATDARKARDSSYLYDAFNETVALAEVLAPGMRVPAYSRSEAPSKTLDSIAGMRRQALDLAYHKADTRGVIEDIVGAGRVPNFKKMTRDSLRTTFRAAASAQKAINNTSAGPIGVGSTQAVGTRGTIKSIGDINKAWNKKHNPTAA